MMKWSEFQSLYPFFWMWLTAWLKSKGAQDIMVIRGVSNSEYVKVRFNIPKKEQELSDSMLFELLDEAGIRVCVDFDTENPKANWRYVIHKKRLNELWTQIHSSEYIFNKEKYAVSSGLKHAFDLVNESLKKQNAVAYH